MTQPWRLIEAELVVWAMSSVLHLDVNHLGDQIVLFDDGEGQVVDEINLTDLAYHLAQSFVPKSTTVKVS